MSKIPPVITKKILSKIASKAIADAKGIFTAEEIFEQVKNVAVSANWRTLLEETCWSVTNSAIDNHATPHLKDISDWFGYGETVLKITENNLVKVKDATINHLDVRVKNVKDNLAKIRQAAETELDRIEKIQQVMRTHNLKLAGDAIPYLSPPAL